MAVLVKYDNKATMTYHLTAYSVSAFSFSLAQHSSTQRGERCHTGFSLHFCLNYVVLSDQCSDLFRSTAGYTLPISRIAHSPFLPCPYVPIFLVVPCSFVSALNTVVQARLTSRLAAMGRLPRHVQRGQRPTRTRSRRISFPTPQNPWRRFGRSSPRGEVPAK